MEHFPSTIERIESRGAKIYILQSVGNHPFDVPQAVIRARKRGKSVNEWALTLGEHRARNAGVTELLERAVEGTGAALLDPLPFFTDDNGIHLVEKDDQLLYRDGSHLSPFGSRQLRPLLEPIFREAIKRGQVRE